VGKQQHLHKTRRHVLPLAVIAIRIQVPEEALAEAALVFGARRDYHLAFLVAVRVGAEGVARCSGDEDRLGGGCRVGGVDAFEREDVGAALDGEVFVLVPVPELRRNQWVLG